MTTKYSYPYIKHNRTIKYVPDNNQYINLARNEALKNSLDDFVKTGAVLVKNDQVLGAAANGSDTHIKYGCKRIEINSKTGEDYHLCEGCQPHNHAEAKLIGSLTKNMIDISSSDIYVWGHYGICRDCWEIIDNFKINNIYLLKNANILFNKASPENILGYSSNL